MDNRRKKDIAAVELRNLHQEWLDHIGFDVPSSYSMELARRNFRGYWGEKEQSYA